MNFLRDHAGVNADRCPFLLNLPPRRMLKVSLSRVLEVNYMLALPYRTHNYGDEGRRKFGM